MKLLVMAIASAFAALFVLPLHAQTVPASCIPVRPSPLIVTLNGNQSVTISWAMPTQNTDCSTPAAVDGFDILEAATTSAMDAISDAPGQYTAYQGNGLPATQLSYVTGVLSPGTYVFAVHAWNCRQSPCAVGPKSQYAVVTVKAAQVPGAPGGVGVK